jgi:hypothetical protein
MTETHSKAISEMILADFSSKKLITAAQDECIVISSLKLEIEAKVNISHPLPSKWGIKSNLLLGTSKTIMYALKAITLMTERKNFDSSEQAKMVQVQSFVASIQQNDSFFTTAIDYD